MSGLTPLAQRFDGLGALASLPLLSEAPTPVAPLARLSRMTGAEIWVKRDDLSASAYGGNKARKLVYLLADAQRRGAKSLITLGGFGSNHVLATCTHGAAHGFDVHAVLLPQPFTKHVRRNLRADLAHGATLHPLRVAAAAPLEIARVRRRLSRAGASPYVIPHGGTSPLGMLGYVDAGLEIAAQIEAGELPEPDAVIVALGSGGTAAGLAVGFAVHGLTTRVVAARVTPSVVASIPFMKHLIRRCVADLHARDGRFPRVANAAIALLEITDEVRARRYGELDDIARRALDLGRTEDLELDPTYTSRALALTLRRAEGPARGGRLLFVNTLSSVDLDPLLARAPALPRWTDRYVAQAERS